MSTATDGTLNQIIKDAITLGCDDSRQVGEDHAVFTIREANGHLFESSDLS